MLDGALLEQVGVGFGTSGLFADDDAAGVQVVVESAAFAQEFWGEDEVLGAEGYAGKDGIADRDGGFDDHHGLRIDYHKVVDHRFDRFRVEVVGLGVVVGGGGNEDVVGINIGFLLIQRGAEVQ